MSSGRLPRIRRLLPAPPLAGAAGLDCLESEARADCKHSDSPGLCEATFSFKDDVPPSRAVSAILSAGLLARADISVASWILASSVSTARLGGIFDRCGSF
jgi:hypothetical protein